MPCLGAPPPGDPLPVEVVLKRRVLLVEVRPDLSVPVQLICAPATQRAHQMPDQQDVAKTRCRGQHALRSPARNPETCRQLAGQRCAPLQPQGAGRPGGARAQADASNVVRRCLPYSVYRIFSTSCDRPDVNEPAPRALLSSRAPPCRPDPPPAALRGRAAARAARHEMAAAQAVPARAQPAAPAPQRMSSGGHPMGACGDAIWSTHQTSGAVPGMQRCCTPVRRARSPQPGTHPRRSPRAPAAPCR